MNLPENKARVKFTVKESRGIKTGFFDADYNQFVTKRTAYEAYSVKKWEYADRTA